MFNNKAKKKKSTKTPSMPAINIISEGTTIEGSLKSEYDIRVAGIIKGHVETKGKFMLTGKGHIEGDIKAESADISGLVEGQLQIEKQLILRKSSVIKGDLFIKSLLVEQGAKFEGMCKMGGTSNSKNKEGLTEHPNNNNGQSRKEKMADNKIITEK